MNIDEIKAMSREQAENILVRDTVQEWLEYYVLRWSLAECPQILRLPGDEESSALAYLCWQIRENAVKHMARPGATTDERTYDHAYGRALDDAIFLFLGNTPGWPTRGIKSNLHTYAGCLASALDLQQNVELIRARREAGAEPADTVEFTTPAA